MSRFGELYDKLIVMPGQRTFPAYYKLVQRVLKEAANEFPMKGNEPFSVRGIDAWFEKWFGVHSLGETANDTENS